MISPPPIGPIEAAALSHAANVRARLMNARAPAPKLIPPRPLSPFDPRRVRAVRTAAQLAAVAAWGQYTPPAPYDAFVPVPPAMAWREIVEHVCDKHRVRYWEITGSTRTRRIVAARQEAFYRLREERQLTWLQIGKLMGGFDHTTVLHGWRAHRAKLDAAGCDGVAA